MIISIRSEASSESFDDIPLEVVCSTAMWDMGAEDLGIFQRKAKNKLSANLPPKEPMLFPN